MYSMALLVCGCCILVRIPLPKKYLLSTQYYDDVLLLLSRIYNNICLLYRYSVNWCSVSPDLYPRLIRATPLKIHDPSSDIQPHSTIIFKSSFEYKIFSNTVAVGRAEKELLQSRIRSSYFGLKCEMSTKKVKS